MNEAVVFKPRSFRFNLSPVFLRELFIAWLLIWVSADRRIRMQKLSGKPAEGWKMKVTHVAAILLVLLGGACETDRGQKEIAGALVGALAGGLLGAQIGGGKGQLAATAVGTLLGAYLGSKVGQSLDRADRIHAERTAQTSLRSSASGRPSAWSNPDNGHKGTFTPVNRYRSADGLSCRDYEQTVTIDGRTETITGTACRGSDGEWRVVNQRS